MALDRKIINDFENKRKNKNYFHAKKIHGMNFLRRFNFTGFFNEVLWHFKFAVNLKTIYHIILVFNV